MKENVVEIKGAKYKYRYNPSTKKTEYVGPIGDAPALSEEEFFRALSVSDDRLVSVAKWFNLSEDALDGILAIHWNNKDPANYTRTLAGHIGIPSSYGTGAIYWKNPTVMENMLPPKKGEKIARRSRQDFRIPSGYQWIQIKDEEIAHGKPVPHEDYCYAASKIEVPKELVPILHEMSGSIQYDPLKKEVTARCHALVKNAVTLKAVEDLVDGKISPKDAGKEYGNRILANSPTGDYWYPKSDLTKKAI